MALTTFLTGEIELDTIDSVNGAQIWQPHPLAMSGNCFVVRALYQAVNPGPMFYRYYVLNAAGQRIATTDFPVPPNISSTPCMVKVDETHWFEAAGDTGGGTSIVNTVNARRFSINPATGAITMDYETTTTVPAPAGCSVVGDWASAAVSDGAVLMASIASSTSDPHGYIVVAYDPSSGQPLWTHNEVQAGLDHGTLDAYAANGKFKLLIATGSIAGDNLNHWFRREYSFDKTGCTALGPLDDYHQTVQWSGSAAGLAPAMTLDPYVMGDDYTADLGNDAAGHTLAQISKSGTSVTVATETGFDGGPEQWPWWRPGGARFAAIADLWYLWPPTITPTGGTNAQREQGVRILMYDPSSSGIEMSDIVYPHWNGQVGDDSTWNYWDETNGGGIATAFDPGTGLGILTVGWVAQPAGDPVQHLLARAWMVQGPSNAPDLTGKPAGVQLSFFRA